MQGVLLLLTTMAKPSHQGVLRGNNKHLILQAGLDLFYQKGFRATGIQEIAAASGLPKGSFYNYFDSKEDFVVSVIQLYTEQMQAFLDEHLLQPAQSPLTNLQQLFSQWSNDFIGEASKGCLACNLTHELATRHPAIKAALEEFFVTVLTCFEACINQAQALGELQNTAAALDIAETVYNSWQGAVMRAKAQGTARPLEQFQQVTLTRLLAA